MSGSGHLSPMRDLACADRADSSRFKRNDGDGLAIEGGELNLKGRSCVTSRIVKHNSTNVACHETMLGHVAGQGDHIQFLDHRSTLNRAPR
jgi:hypothetical protein